MRAIRKSSWSLSVLTLHPLVTASHPLQISCFNFSSVSQVVKQCCGTDGVEANYIKTEILPPFFKHFWQHRMALDRRNYRQVSRRQSLDELTFISQLDLNI